MKERKSSPLFLSVFYSRSLDTSIRDLHEYIRQYKCLLPRT